ncbi:DUF4852 domain-containing protein [Candidatus Uabimicrobium amorphum]|uniref:Uncharacterized protein n=1 Tax=Uabimicrobium amorphum TaxID=2596890 RepID=A0A5S9ITM6_UABAM|nr:DUF4852 domain-containing protein [Candidatus Uabimicrobium amorphum]BBM86415.1 hypothetical protein UABAM_04801 [Candidatus Uabimicrobium amorphum]
MRKCLWVKSVVVLTMLTFLYSEEDLTKRKFTVAFLSLQKRDVAKIQDELFEFLSNKQYLRYRYAAKKIYEKKRQKFISKLQKSIGNWKKTNYKITLTGNFGEYNFKKQRFRIQNIIAVGGEQKLSAPILLYRSTNSLKIPAIVFTNTKKFRSFFVPLETAKQLYDSRKYEQPMNRNVQIDIYATLNGFRSGKISAVEFTISRLEVFDEEKNLLSIVKPKAVADSKSKSKLKKEK